MTGAQSMTNQGFRQILSRLQRPFRLIWVGAIFWVAVACGGSGGGPASSDFSSNANGTVGNGSGNPAAGTTSSATIPNGISLLAGSATSPGSKDGPLRVATFFEPGRMTADSLGNVYVADGCAIPHYGYGQSESVHGLVRKISPDGQVTTVAGTTLSNRAPSTVVNNQNTIGARIACVAGLAVHPDGSIYLADSFDGKVHRITAAGVASVVYDSVTAAEQLNASGRSISRSAISSIAIDSAGNLLVARFDTGVIQRINSQGVASAYAGDSSNSALFGDMIVIPALSQPNSMRFAADGSMIIGDRDSVVQIRGGVASSLVDPSSASRLPCPGFRDMDVSTDGQIALLLTCNKIVLYRAGQLQDVVDPYDGPLDLAAPNYPPRTGKFPVLSAIKFTTSGALLIADALGAHLKRYDSASRAVSIFAGQGVSVDPVDGTAAEATVFDPFCLLHTENQGTYFSHGARTLRNVDREGKVKTIASNPALLCALKVESDGTFFALSSTPNSAINSSQFHIGTYDRDGRFLANVAGINDPAIEPFVQISSTTNLQGELVLNDDMYQIGVVRSGAFLELVRERFGSGFYGAVAYTKANELIAADSCYLTKITSDNQQISLTGSPGSQTLSCGYQDGPAKTARFFGISGIAIGPRGEIYVVDSGNALIRRLFNGEVTTIAGTPGVNDTRLGPLPGSLYKPRQVAFDVASHSLIVSTDHAILRISVRD